MNRNRVIFLLSAVIFLLLFLLSGRIWGRLDLTRNKAYTISEVSRNLYKEIPDQVRITYFVSEKLTQAHPLPGSIADLIREYAAHSRGKIRFSQKDPAKAEVQTAVEELGIIPQQIQLAEKNEVTVAMIYSGILIEYLDREAVIPIVFSLDTLEYDLSSRIRSLVRNTNRELGVIVGDAHKQWVNDYGALYRELIMSGFNVRQIQPGEEIPQTMPALFVLGGVEDLDEYSQYLIDRYLTGGGNVLFALDGVFVDTRGSLEIRAMQDKGLLAMLANYGVILRPELVLDRSALNLTFQTQTGNRTVIQTIRYPQWIGVREANSDHSITAGFAGLDLYWASPLLIYPPQGISAETLFTSTSDAWLQTTNFFSNPNLMYRFEEELGNTSGTKTLAASLSGIFPGAFEGRPVPVPEGMTEDEHTEVLPPVLKRPSRLIVVGDADFAGNLMQVNRSTERNLSFLIKAADWLSSDDDMVAIRGREAKSGRLDRIDDRETRDAVMVLSRTLNTIIIPLGIILIGLVIVLRRKAKTSREKGHPSDV